MVGRIVAGDLEAIKALAVLGEGIAWLLDFLAADELEAGSLVSVLPNWKPKAMGIVSLRLRQPQIYIAQDASFCSGGAGDHCVGSVKVRRGMVERL